MMREVAKSMVGFSWAVSLFSLQQVAKLVTPSSEPANAAAQEFDELSRAVQSHFSAPVAERFRAADEWQGRLVDAMFDAVALGPARIAASVDPRTVADAIDPRRVVRNSVDFVTRSVDTIRAGAPAAGVPPVM